MRHAHLLFIRSSSLSDMICIPHPSRRAAHCFCERGELIVRPTKCKYGFLWVTLVLFAFSLSGHWLFGWFAYVHEAHATGQPVEIGDYAVEMLRDTFENWQSEFLQLAWQVVGLAYLLY